MNTNHVVVAKLDGQRFRVKVHPTYDRALAQWSDLDDALRAGRLAIVGPALYQNINTARLVDPRAGQYLAVRASDDPQWASAPVIKLAAIRKGRGSRRLDPIIKRLGAEAGLHGHAGGWLYRGSTNHAHRAGDGLYCRLTSYQGWSSWFYHRQRAVGTTKAADVLSINGRFHRVDETGPLDPPATVPCDDCGRTGGQHDPDVEH